MGYMEFKTVCQNCNKSGKEEESQFWNMTLPIPKKPKSVH